MEKKHEKNDQLRDKIGTLLFKGNDSTVLRASLEVLEGLVRLLSNATMQSNINSLEVEG